MIKARELPVKAGPVDARTRIIVDEAVGAKNMTVGHMVFPEGGTTDTHTRAVEECVYILKGRSTLFFDESEAVLEAGDAIFIPPGIQHRHENTGVGEMEHIFFFSPQGPEKGIHALPDAE